MNKMIGAASILLASFLTALLRLRSKGERILMLRSLETSLLSLRDELSERQRSLGEVFQILSRKNENRSVRAFYHSLYSGLETLGERGFAEIWRETAEECFGGAGDKLCDALFPLGGFLGGSELDRQCAALDRAARSIGELRHAEKDELRSERKLNLALALAAGAFLVIILM